MEMTAVHVERYKYSLTGEFLEGHTARSFDYFTEYLITAVAITVLRSRLEIEERLVNNQFDEILKRMNVLSTNPCGR